MNSDFEGTTLPGLNFLLEQKSKYKQVRLLEVLPFLTLRRIEGTALVNCFYKIKLVLRSTC